MTYILKEKPSLPVVKVELQVPEHVGDDGPVLLGHVHPHEHHHRHEVHAHDLREEEHQHVGALGRGDPDEKFRHGQQQTPEFATNIF